MYLVRGDGLKFRALFSALGVRDTFTAHDFAALTRDLSNVHVDGVLPPPSLEVCLAALRAVVRALRGEEEVMDGHGDDASDADADADVEGEGDGEADDEGAVAVAGALSPLSAASPSPAAPSPAALALALDDLQPLFVPDRAGAPLSRPLYKPLSGPYLPVYAPT